MLELRLVQATLFKSVLEAISDPFSKAHFDISGTGLELQAMDTSGVALVALLLPAEAFDHYRCDRHLSMGLSLADMAKAFRCANNDDIVTIKAEDDWFDTVTFTFESPEDDGEISYFDFDFVGTNGVPFEIPEPPESEYQAIVLMPSAKFMRICKKLSSFGVKDTVVISAFKNHVKFFTVGKTGSLTILCRQTHTVDKVSTLSDQVTISLSSKLPTMFEYKIAEMGYIRYYMFPMTAKEDEMETEGDESRTDD